MISLKFLGLLLSAALFVSATDVGTTTIVECTTKQSSKSVQPIPTSTKTATINLWPKVIVSKTHKTVAVSQKPVTTTITEIVLVTQTITDVAVTGTFSTTSTYTDTLTDTQFITTTLTSISNLPDTTVIETSTVPTPDGFKPIADTLGGYPAAPVKARVVHPHRREILDRAPSKGPGCNDKSYPASVQCLKKVVKQVTHSVLIPGKAITQTLPPQTITSNVQATETTTLTIVPSDVTVTESFSTTVTTTETEVATVSTVETVIDQVTISQTTTSYAACATNNIIGPILPDGRNVYNVYFGAAGGFRGAPGSSHVDCCEQCQRAEFCSGVAYNARTGFCNLLTTRSGTCTAPHLTGSYFVTNPDRSYSYGLSNGPCGYIYDGGAGV